MTAQEVLAMRAAWVVAFVAFGALCAYSYDVRGYAAFGGEWLMFMIPLFVRVLLEVRRAH